MLTALIEQELAATRALLAVLDQLGLGICLLDRTLRATLASGRGLMAGAHPAISSGSNSAARLTARRPYRRWRSLTCRARAAW